MDVKPPGAIDQRPDGERQARKGDGVGLGLSLVAEHVRVHGGKVWAEARVGEGATFHFTLG